MHLLTISRPILPTGLAMLLACGVSTSAFAQESGSDANPSQLLNRPPSDVRPDRQIMVGTFIAYAPAYLGADEYQLMAGPNIQVRYDRAFLSVQEGLGYDLVRSGELRAGPTIGLRQPRRENGSSPLRIAGDRSDDLRGLGTIKATADIGGFIAYERGPIAAKLDVRQATNSDLGLIATLGVRYTRMIPISSRPGPPALVSFGLRVSFVDDKYNQSYFGVTAEQSTRSGLKPFDADGGLLSAGLGASAVVPLNGRVSAIFLAGYDRLAGDAARSPLVEERGSRNQATAGLGFVYRFGL